MTVNRWLLPEGIEEILPAEAYGVESLRRRLLDLYDRWGYELVMPPLLEFTDSLLSGVGSDLNLLTLKVTDQLSGQLMGLRADMTPQAARIDAHSYIKQGVNRLCYADHVLHAKPKSPLAVRTPLQAGVELFGEAGLDADIEVVSLLLESLSHTGVNEVTLALGHVGICRALLEQLSLSPDQESEFFALLDAKDKAGLEQWVAAAELGADAYWLPLLPTLCGDHTVLETARQQLQDAPDEVAAAIDELVLVSQQVQQRYPDVNFYFDLAELRGYHYHTGIVFAAYAQGFGEAIANGGRYDHIGEIYGRARPATGFGLNLTSVLGLLSSLPQSATGIYAPSSEDSSQWDAIQTLRSQGERVVCGLSTEPDYQELRCDRQLVLVGNEYVVKPV